MAETKRHKVFISFQHGCEDTVHLCGKKTTNTWYGPQTNFTTCNGLCGRNGVGLYPLHSQCRYFYKCGHYWKERFEFLMVDKTDKAITKAVGDGDIRTDIATETIRQKIRDEFIADASVTVVLIGPETWKRKHVDWEISASIKDTQKNPRCGLFGLLLPTHPSFNQPTYNQYIVPPRLYYNQASGFAHIYSWTEDVDVLQNMIHNAFVRKDKENIDNSYPMFSNNRRDDQTQWQP